MTYQEILQAHSRKLKNIHFQFSTIPFSVIIAQDQILLLMILGREGGVIEPDIFIPIKLIEIFPFLV